MPEVPGPAVDAALAAYAHALYDRPTPTHLSDEALMRIVLRAAIPLLCPEGTVTEWALAYTRRPGTRSGLPARRVIQPYPDEATAGEAVAEIRRAMPGDEPALMRREVTPWTPVPGEEGTGD